MTKDVSVKLIKSFLAVVEKRGISKAANHLGLTQPAVSQHLKQLEGILETQLINRGVKGVLLTEAGEDLLPQLKSVVHEQDALLAKVRQVGLANYSRIRVATPASLAVELLIPAFNALRKKFPRTVFSIKEADDDAAHQMVRSQQVDIALTGTWIPTADLEFEELFQDRACVIFPRGHPLSELKEVSVEKLEEYPYIRAPMGTAADFMLAQAMSSANINLNVAYEAEQLFTTVQLVRNCQAISIIPGLSVIATRMLDIEARPLALPGAIRHCGVVLPRRRKANPALSELLSAIRLQLATLNSEKNISFLSINQMD